MEVTRGVVTQPLPRRFRRATSDPAIERAGLLDRAPRPTAAASPAYRPYTIRSTAVARFLIVGGGERASALKDALEREGHVARVLSRPDRDALEHVAIVCWLSEESPERFLLSAIDSSVRGFVYHADGWEEAVLETARRNAIPVAVLGSDGDEPEAWLAEAQGAITSLIERPDSPRRNAMLSHIAKN